MLRQSVQLHDPSKHVAIDATFYECSAMSRHYCQQISYCVQKLKAMKLVDIEPQAVLDIHCSTTRKEGDADLPEQITHRNADKLRSLAVIRAMTNSHSATHYVNSVSDCHQASYLRSLRSRSQWLNRRTTLQSVLYDLNRELSCQALTRLRRASTFLVS